MPLFPAGRVVSQLPGSNQVDEPMDPSLSQMAGAAFRGLPTVSAAQYLFGYDSTPDPNFDPYALNDPVVARYPRAFEEVDNQQSFDARKQQIAREEADNEVRAASPFMTAALDLGLGALDPTSWVPVVGAGASLGRIGMVGRAVVGASAGAQGAAVGEGILQAVEATRRIEDAPASIGFGAIFGSILGPAVGALQAKAGSRSAIIGTIRDAASKHGVDADTLVAIAKLESELDPRADNPKSSAGGLFQFIDSTWAAYGNGADKKDAVAASDAGARLLADNRAALRRALGRDPAPWELYLAHQQGGGGAAKLLEDPNARAVEVVGKDAIKLNGGTEDMSAGEFAGLWKKKYEAVGGRQQGVNAIAREASDRTQRSVLGDWTLAPQTFDDIRTRLSSAGMPEEEAEAAAKLTAAHYSIMADGTGRSADELYRATSVLQAPEPLARRQQPASPDPLPDVTAAAPEQTTAPEPMASVIPQEPERAPIAIARQAFATEDPADFIRQAGATYADSLRMVVESPDAPPELRIEYEALAKRAQESPEQLADDFHASLRGEKTGAAALDAAIDRFSGWLGAIYRTLDDLPDGVEMSDGVRNLMDGIFAREAPETVAEVEGGSASAASIRSTDIADEQLSGGIERVARILEGNSFITGTPLGRLETSPEIASRQIVEDLLESSLSRRKHRLGVASPIAVQTLVNNWQRSLYEGIIAVDKAHLATRKAGVKMSRAEFAEAIGMAMRRADQADDLNIPDIAKAHVSQAAADMRRIVFDPLKNEAIKAGLLPEDVAVETALSYLTRVYDKEKIIRQRPQFNAIVTNWLAGAQQQVAEIAEALADKRSKAAADLIGIRKRFDDLKLPANEVRKYERLRGQRTAANRAAKDAERMLSFIQGRQSLFTSGPAADVPNGGLKDILTALRTGRGLPKEPERFSTWIRRRGGINDSEFSADIKSITGTDRGNIKNTGGLSIDDLMVMAIEDGWFPDLEPGTIPDAKIFLDKLSEDLKGSPVYRADAADTIGAINAVKDIKRALDEKGIDPRKSTENEMYAALSGNEKVRRVSPDRLKELAMIEGRLKKAAVKAREHAYAVEREAYEAEKRVQSSRSGAGSLDLAEHQRSLIARAETRIANIEKKIEENRAFADATPDELADIADQITEKITSGHPGLLNYEVVPLARGPLKERTFSIPDSLIEDYLISDVDHVARIYVRTMAPDVELTKRFGRADLEDAISKIKDGFNRKIANADTEAKRDSLQDRKNSDVADVAAIRDMLRNTYGMPSNPDALIVRAGRVARNLNYIRALGGMTISALSDLARPVMVHGMLRVVRDGLPVLVSRSRFKAAAEEVKLAGTALDMVLDQRMHSFSDVMDEYGRQSRFERGLSYAASRFGIATLMTPWNAALKQWVGIITQAHTLRAIEAWSSGGKIKPAEIERLARLGIDHATAQRIARQFSAHGDRTGGVFQANTGLWDDAGAVRHYRAALAREVDETIVTVGPGNRPLWMSTELGKTIGQFKSFSIASTNRVTLAGLQRRDAGALNGVLMMIGLGMVAYAIKRKDDSDDPRVWLREGIDRSGITGWLFDVNNIVEKLTQGTIGASALIGGHTGSRFQSVNAVGSLLGPTFGGATDLAWAGGSAISGNFGSGDTRRLRRLVPLQNLFYVRWLFDRAEDGINSSFGLQKAG